MSNEGTNIIKPHLWPLPDLLLLLLVTYSALYRLGPPSIQCSTS